MMRFNRILCAALIAAAAFSSPVKADDDDEIRKGGMEVRIGDVRLVRAFRKHAPGTVRIGSKVITTDGREGIITGMFIDKNKVVVQDDYYGNRNWTTDQIAVTQGCMGPFCIGDKAVVSDGREGIVAGYFNSGALAVKDDYYGNRIREQAKVAVMNACSEHFCSGDTVITADGRAGILQGFLGDGRVAVKDDYYGNRFWKRSDVAVTQAVCANIFVRRVGYCR